MFYVGKVIQNSNYFSYSTNPLLIRRNLILSLENAKKYGDNLQNRLLRNLF